MVKKCAQHWSNKSGQTDILQWLIATQDHLSRLRQTEVWIEQWIMNNELMERIFNIEMSEISMEQSKPSIWPDCLNLRKPICQGLAKVLESKSFHAKGNQVYHHYFPSLTRQLCKCFTLIYCSLSEALKTLQMYDAQSLEGGEKLLHQSFYLISSCLSTIITTIPSSPPSSPPPPSEWVISQLWILLLC